MSFLLLARIMLTDPLIVRSIVVGAVFPAPHCRPIHIEHYKASTLPKML